MANMRYMRICPICGNTFETNNKELMTCIACSTRNNHLKSEK